ncbi:MAG: hypothetical protein QGD96_09175 [Anaerolineae bacterium]|nr:hypothetical protein [Anaerolineae bacterium]
MALLYPQGIHRAALLPGFLLVDTHELLSKDSLKEIPFIVAHSTQDELVPLEVPGKPLTNLSERVPMKHSVRTKWDTSLGLNVYAVQKYFGKMGKKRMVCRV